MKIAALIFGILAGLSALPLATYAHALVAIFGAQQGVLFYLLPIASFVGGGIAPKKPELAAGLLAASAVVLLLIGAKFGYAVNIITIGPVILNGLGAAFALLGWQEDSTHPAQAASRADQANRSPYTPVFPSGPQQPAAQFDRAKWNALVKYDADIRGLAEKIKQLGEKWVDVFAADYLALNDKEYLPEIVRKIITDAKAEKLEEERQRLRRAEEQRVLEGQRLRLAELQRLEVERRIDDRRRAKARVGAFFWGTFPRRAATTALGLLTLCLAGIAAWSYYELERRRYDEPFAYCRAMVNRDTSDIPADSRWIGDASPALIRDRLIAKPSFRWRCMDGRVYACVHAKNDCYDRFSPRKGSGNDQRGYPVDAWVTVLP